MQESGNKNQHIRRYSSPFRNQNINKNESTLNQLLQNMNLNYKRKSSEKKQRIKYMSVSRKTSKDVTIESIQTPQIFRHQFQLQYIIGIGGFGRTFAMKEMSKALVLFKRSVKSIMTELQFLTELRHSFLINVHKAFQDTQNLYLVLDYLSGGDLRYHLGRVRKFSEIQTKFFAACIITGLEYLHNNRIIHRDIKPENLILDQNGYVRITDLGVAVKKYDTLSETSGTPGYMAPEVMLRQDHGIQADYFALGVICYEFMTGRRPYQGNNRQEIRTAILSKQVQLQAPIDGWSIEAIDFINQLIQRKPQNRLQNLKQHPWWDNFPWEQLQQQNIKAPFLPTNKDNFDKQQIIFEDEENQQIIKLNQQIIRDNQALFDNYSFEKKQIVVSKRNSFIDKDIFLQQDKRSNLLRSFLVK